MSKKNIVNILTLLAIICMAGILSMATANADDTEDIENESEIGASDNNPEEVLIMGDANLDGTVNYLDAMVVLRYDAELISLTEDQMTCADVVYDGEVNYLDAIIILRYDAELIDEFDDIQAEEVEEQLEIENALLVKTGNFESGIGLVYIIDMSDLTVDEVDSIVKIVADITVDSGYCNGILCGYVDGEWACMINKGEISGDGKTSGQFVWEFDGSLVGYDEDGNFYPYAEAQLWRVAPFYDEDENEIGDGTAILTAVTLYDADGNVVKAF